MPYTGSFKSADTYASVRGHETVHWTGHASRLDRTFGKRFGDNAYCVEELVAELGSAMICGDLGLPTELHDSHASYLANWLKMLRADKTAIFLAASKAEQAFSYLRAFSTEATAETRLAA
jgi:antirestriction protein ArdC